MQNNQSTEQNVLILEKLNSNLLGSTNANNHYILEGVFAEFNDSENENGRIYKESDYLPHLKYLQESIKRANLVGELDHPEKMEPSLAKASHIIESLEYNKETRQLCGRVRLLTNSHGSDARRLLEDGVQLSISSRSLGKVRADKTVDIQKIITFDLVAQPGFKNAQLYKINESLGYADNDNLAIYSISNEDYEDFNSNENKKFNNFNMDNTNKTKNIQEEDLVKRIAKLEQKIGKQTNESSDIENRLQTLENYLEEFSGEVLENQNYKSIETNYIDLQSDVNLIKRYLEEFTSKYNVQLEHLRPYLDSFAEQVSESVTNIEKYQDYISESVTNIENYQDYISESVTNLENYQDHVSESVTNLENYQDHVSESVTNLENYQDHVSESVTNLENYQDQEVHNTITNLVEYVEYNTKLQNSFINYQDEVNKEIYQNNISDTTSTNHQETNESYIQKKRSNLETIKENFNAIIESVTNKKLQATNESNFKSYLTFLNESQRKQFLILDDNIKQKIIEETLIGRPTNESQFVAIINRNINPMTQEDVNSDLLSYLPRNLKPVFESLDEKVKNQIFEEAKLWNFRSAVDKKQFWMARKSLFESVVNTENNNIINENKIVMNSSQNLKANYMDNLKLQLNRFL